MSTQLLFHPGQPHQIQTLPNATAVNSLRIFKLVVDWLASTSVEGTALTAPGELSRPSALPD